MVQIPCSPALGKLFSVNGCFIGLPQPVGKKRPPSKGWSCAVWWSRGLPYRRFNTTLYKGFLLYRFRCANKNTNKYIILHDTTVDEIYGETVRLGLDANKQSQESGLPVDEINKGLWPAVEEFLETNTEWYIKERFVNNNGLTILARKFIV